MQIFPQRAAPSTNVSQIETLLGVGDVEISEDFVRFAEKRFRLSDVMTASVNQDTVPDDGIGGSVSVKTREYEPGEGLVQKVYKATFDEEAIKTVIEMTKKIEALGVSVKSLNILDISFRRAFF